MDDSDTNSQTGLVRNRSPTNERNPDLTWKERTGAILQSRRFHNAIFALIVIDCIIVIIELSFTLLTECRPIRGFLFEEAYRPQWLQVLLYISFAISCIFLLEIPPSLYAFGFRYYNPWSDVHHSTFHFFDALIIILNFALLFLSGPAQELVALIVLLRLWRLIKLLGGVASGVEAVNNTLQHRLETCEKELAAKTQELEETKSQLDTLQRKLDATQP